MKETRLLMGMPVTLEVVDPAATQQVLDATFGYFEYIDAKFSTYKEHSEISLLNRGELTLEETSYDMRTIFRLAEQIKQVSGGYFDIHHGQNYDPSGLVKGWAIFNAAEMLRGQGFENFYVEAGGDFQVYGKNSHGQDWRVGIRNPFQADEIVKVLSISDQGIATSGTYVRGAHIYNPKDDARPEDRARPEDGTRPEAEIVSLTVIGPDIYLADCFATAAFAMGAQGIAFIEKLEDFEGYMIDVNRQATYTSGFMRYAIHDQNN
jgi:FAD:protein FMN transferase